MKKLCALTSWDPLISLHNTFMDLVHNTFSDHDLVHNTFSKLDSAHNTFPGLDLVHNKIVNHVCSTH
jgi:hypothetical protein